MSKIDEKRERQETCRSKNSRFVLHPLFIAMGVLYCFTGELPLFLTSCLVALQHECAHAFAASRFGYKLNKIVLMPYGAVIDGDLRGITLHEEIAVAIWGPLCNLFTAFFFGALWWFFPVTYPYTELAYYSSLSVAVFNLLPAYPLDGGRVLRCLLARTFYKKSARRVQADEKAERVCRFVSLAFFLAFTALFFCTGNATALTFGVFLLAGVLGNRRERAVYEKMDFSLKNALKKGVEIRRIAVLKSLPIKDALKFVSPDAYLVLEVYDKRETHLFDLSQNELSALFLSSVSPLQTLGEIKKPDFEQKSTNFA